MAQGSLRWLMLRTSLPGQQPSEEAIRAASERLKGDADVQAPAAMVRGRPNLWVSDAQMSAVRVPTLAVVGSLDPNAVGVAALSKAMPSLKVIVIQGTVHAAGAANGTVRSPEFVSAVRTWIAEHKTNQ